MVRIFNSTDSASVSTTGHKVNIITPTGHGISRSDQTLINSIVSEIKDCIKISEISEISDIYTLLKEVQQFQIESAQGFVPISETDLNDIYDHFVKPYIECEIYEIGSIVDVIRLNKIINEQISVAKTPKAKLMLEILRDIMTVVVNARNDKVGLIQYKNQISLLDSKYKECNIEVIRLRQRIEDLLSDNKEIQMGVLKGKLGINVRKFKPTIYMQARIDIDRAWYYYLYPGCIEEPDKYQSTIAYVRSFGTLKNAYDTLINLLDEKYATYDDDLEIAEKSLKVKEIKEN
jgi:hypothetical protein